MGAKLTVKGRRKLLTGKMADEYAEPVALQTVVTHCPGKWVFVDAQGGRLYSWDVLRKCWVSPKRKVGNALKAALKAMRG